MYSGPQFDPKDEFEWEATLKKSDAYAARYFQLLRRFSDLPEADALIATRLRDEFREGVTYCDLNCENCPHQWTCEYADQNEPDAQSFVDDLTLDNEADQAPGDDGFEAWPGDALFYETHPAFQLLQHCALGWCNIYAAVMSPEDRQSGLRVLFHLGRALSHMAASVGNGLDVTPAAATAFAKRGLAQINCALGEIHAFERNKPQFRKLLSGMREHVLKARSAMFDHLESCRSKDETN